MNTAVVWTTHTVHHGTADFVAHASVEHGKCDTKACESGIVCRTEEIKRAESSTRLVHMHSRQAILKVRYTKLVRS